MTPQEHELLTGFLDNLAAARVASPDADADRLIRDAFSRQPQAAYLLVQQALLQQMALRDAQARVAQLEQQLQGQQGAAAGASFLGTAGQPQAPFTPPPATGRGWSTPPTGQAPGSTSGMGDFLRSAATTAAGVAGGALLFQGLESLFGGHRGGFGGGLFGGGTPDIVENNTFINEYDDPAFLRSGSADPFLDAGTTGDDDFGDDGFGVDGGQFDDGGDDGGWV